MKSRINKKWSLIHILIAFVVMAGYGNSEETKKAAQNQAVGARQVQQVQTAAPAATVLPAAAAKQSAADDIAVSVDGKILKKSEVEKDVRETLHSLKDKIPADKVKEMRKKIAKQLVEGFILRTLMSNEAERRKIGATDKEIRMAIDEIKENLPPDKKVETFMKENKISREHIVLGIKVKKMVKQDLGKKAKPSQKEISKFFDENKEQFVSPENVHVRHVLIAFAEGDNDKVKAEKKARIEYLRNQLVNGADFAEIARNNSDCSSRNEGGYLGAIIKGQTEKPFEEAAFSQAINAIGPIVTTEYGYHVIEVLERKPQKAFPLEEVTSKISSHLEQKNREEAFRALADRLREKAKIIIYEN
jgi:peptidyl-prolyl cis-trans isomerase C